MPSDCGSGGTLKVMKELLYLRQKKEKQYVCLVFHAEMGAACADLSASVDVS